jgi:hypothetical protein
MKTALIITGYKKKIKKIQNRFVSLNKSNYIDFFDTIEIYSGEYTKYPEAEDLVQKCFDFPEYNTEEEWDKVIAAKDIRIAEARERLFNGKKITFPYKEAFKKIEKSISGDLKNITNQLDRRHYLLLLEKYATKYSPEKKKAYLLKECFGSLLMECKLPDYLYKKEYEFALSIFQSMLEQYSSFFYLVNERIDLYYKDIYDEKMSANEQLVLLYYLENKKLIKLAFSTTIKKAEFYAILLNRNAINIRKILTTLHSHHRNIGKQIEGHKYFTKDCLQKLLDFANSIGLDELSKSIQEDIEKFR